MAVNNGLRPAKLTARSIRIGSATLLDTVAAKLLGVVNDSVVAAAGHWAQGANGQHAGVIAYQERPQDRAKTQALYASGNGHTVQQLKFHYDTAAHAVEL